MQDTGFIAVRPNTRMTITDHKAEGGADDKVVINLLRGGFRSVTGWIGKFNPRAYRIVTPTATIGVRGTDHEPRYIPEDSSEGEPGTYDKVYVGATTITSGAGGAEVAPDQAGFAPAQASEKPRLLASVPTFFRRGRHEAEIEKKHLEIQRLIDQRRDERRQVIAAKKAELAAAQGRLRELREQSSANAAPMSADEHRQRRELLAAGEALRRRFRELVQQQNALRDRSRALEQSVASGTVRRRDNRDERRAVQQESVDTRTRRIAMDQEIKAWQQRWDAAEDARLRAAPDESPEIVEQLRAVRQMRDELQREREETREEIHDMREQERARVREEREGMRGRAGGGGRIR